MPGWAGRPPILCHRMSHCFPAQACPSSMEPRCCDILLPWHRGSIKEPRSPAATTKFILHSLTPDVAFQMKGRAAGKLLHLLTPQTWPYANIQGDLFCLQDGISPPSMLTASDVQGQSQDRPCMSRVASSPTACSRSPLSPLPSRDPHTSPMYVWGALGRGYSPSV